MTFRSNPKAALSALLMMVTILFAGAVGAGQPATSDGLHGKRILVLSKTAGYRHSSIPAGQAALLELSRKYGFTTTFTEDTAEFTDSNLKQFDAVVFLSTTGDIFGAAQQAAFERYIKAGHGLLGIHSAADTETDGKWPWYTALIGARFRSHPAIQEARLVAPDRTDQAIISSPSLKDLAELKFVDEWYDFSNISSNVEPILRIDRGSYQGSTAVGLEPIVWRNRYSGGRAFYVGLGHREESYASPIVQDLIVQGLRYAVGEARR